MNGYLAEASEREGCVKEPRPWPGNINERGDKRWQ